MEAQVKAVITAASDTVVANLIVDAFKEVEKHFYLKAWKTSELDSGHFVEGVRRLLEHRLFGHYTPVGKSLPNFNDQELKRYENQAAAHESYRIHIPRLLQGVYVIRNKRGVGHVALVAPNYMDAVYVLSCCKWVLAEIFRLESGLSPHETALIIDKVVERNIEGIWEENGNRRIIAQHLKSHDETILFALFDKSPQSTTELQAMVEARTPRYFLKRLQKLHDEKLITLTADGLCIISPIGRKEAEKIVSRAVT